MMDDRKENCTSTTERFECQLDCEDGSRNTSKKGTGNRLWKKVKYQLVEYHSLPGYLRDNEYILGHYRSEWPLKQVSLASSPFTMRLLMFGRKHLIGFFIFLSLTVYTAMKVPKVMDLHSVQQISSMLRNTDLSKVHKEYLNLPSLPNMADFHRLRDDLKTSLPSMDFIPSVSGWQIVELVRNCVSRRFSTAKTPDDCFLQNVKSDLVDGVTPLVIQPITRWPFFAFLGGAMFCLLASSTCHLRASYSERLAYIMLRLDYAGIAALISTSMYPLVYYSFMCNPFICYLYMGFITVLGVATIIFSLLPIFQNPHFRSTRASLFFRMGFSGVTPIIHKLILYRNQPEALQTTGYELLMGAFYGIGALIYALRIPERWKPGKFDIAGHSHQLFHILVVAGVYTHYRAGLVYLRWRDTVGC